MSSQLSSASLRAFVNFVHTNVVDPGNGGVIPAASDNQNIGLNAEYKFGSGALQAQTVWHDTRVLAIGANEELDLNGAAIQNVFGEDLDFINIKAMLIVNHDTTGHLLIGGAAANGFNSWVSDPTDEVIVLPGGALSLIAPTADGYLVTPATADLLRIEDVAGTLPKYSIVLIGDRS